MLQHFTIGTLNRTAFDSGLGRIWLSDVNCTGSEETILSCTTDSSQIDSCSHDNDTGVMCTVGMSGDLVGMYNLRPYYKLGSVILHHS